MEEKKKKSGGTECLRNIFCSPEAQSFSLAFLMMLQQNFHDSNEGLLMDVEQDLLVVRLEKSHCFAPGCNGF